MEAGTPLPESLICKAFSVSHGSGYARIALQYGPLVYARLGSLVRNLRFGITFDDTNDMAGPVAELFSPARLRTEEPLMARLEDLVRYHGPSNADVLLRYAKRNASVVGEARDKSEHRLLEHPCLWNGVCQ